MVRGNDVLRYLVTQKVMVTGIIHYLYKLTDFEKCIHVMVYAVIWNRNSEKGIVFPQI